jgi:hypothetical protein
MWMIGLVLAVVGLRVAPADAAPLPSYDGILTFPTIRTVSDSEEYSWTVRLYPGETLLQIDDQHAIVKYEEDSIAEQIWAEPAHDATGAAVPTSIAVSEEDIVTLTVHHRAGNQFTGGTPFSYPVMPGPPFTVGYSTVTVSIPPPYTEESDRGCHVPRLKGYNVREARKVLLKLGCTLGKVHRRQQAAAKATGQIVKQGLAAGSDMPAGSSVWVTLGTDKTGRKALDALQERRAGI